MRKWKYNPNTFVFVGLSVLAVLIFVMSRLADKKVEDLRILGVHSLPTVTPVRPTSTPTPKPTTFICIRDGLSTSNPEMCCSKQATYVWSSYVCGEVKPTSTSTPTPTPKITSNPKAEINLRPTLVSTEKTVVSPTSRPLFVNPIPTIINYQGVSPKIRRVTDCTTAVLDVNCVGTNGKTCQWYRGENCVWVCNRNCVEIIKCKEVNLATKCINDRGQTCQEYQNSDCSISCNMNCRSNNIQNFSSVFKSTSKNSCVSGVDYNKDGITNSLDIVFCNKKPKSVEIINSVVDRVKTNIPFWFEWVTVKLGW